MRKLLLTVGLLCAASPALADGTINTLSAGSGLGGTELIPMFQGANPAKTTTPIAIGTYLTGTFVSRANNLSDLANVTTARTNLGLGPLATSASISAALDTIGSTVGGTLYRGAGGWAYLGPGSNGQVLTLSTGLPSWQNATGGGLTVPNAAILSGNGSTLGSIALGSGLSMAGPFPNQTLNATVFTTNNVIPKGNGTGLASSSLTDDGTTLTSTEQFVAAGLKGTDLAGSGVRCVHVDNTGKASIASGDCATGGSGSVTQVNSGTGITVSPSPITTTGSVSLATLGPNSALANVTGASAVPTAAALPTCPDVGGNHFNYTSGTGFSCGTSSSGGGGGLSGMSAGQVPIAATATTVTSSQATATTGNSVILQTDATGHIDAGTLPGGLTTGGSTISATDFKNNQSYLAAAAGVTWTLPAASSLAALTNSAVMFRTLGVQATLALTSGTDAINGGTAGASITIPADSAGIFCTTNGSNAFTCPLGGGATDRIYALSWFSGVDMTAHPVPFGRTGKPRTITGLSCRTEVPVGAGAVVDIYVAAAGQTPPASGTKLTPSPITANGAAGSEVLVNTTLLSTTFANASWLVAVFTGAGWVPNVGSGACQVSTQ